MHSQLRELQRFLDPEILARIASLDLVAKVVVDGFIAGLHRSPDFGFSQEFAEYQAYSPGDDLRHIDWNVFARTERCYLKRYRGETNTRLTILLDASASMAYGSHKVRKIDYARYLAASLAHLGIRQRDAVGLIVYDDDIRHFVRPSTRQGQLHRLLHGINSAEPRGRTDFARPFAHLREFVRWRGIVLVLSDFYEEPSNVVRVIEPLAYKGNDVILFHVLDPQELRLELAQPVLMVDMETGEQREVSPEYLRGRYQERMQQHIRALEELSKQAGMDYYLVVTDRPLDGALREYLTTRQGRM